MQPIEVQRHRNIVTVATDTKKRMYAIIHLCGPAGFDPADFTLSHIGHCQWEVAFEDRATAHRFKRLLEEACTLITAVPPKAPA